MIMRVRLLILVLLAMVVGLYAEPADKIVAIVGKEIILQSDLSKQIKNLKSAKVWQDSTSESDILNDMIETRLIIQKAKEMKLETDEFKIKSMAEKQISQIKAQFKSEDEFRSELAKTGLSVTDLRKYYEELLTEQRLKEMIVQDEVKRKVQVTDKEIEDYYLKHKEEIPEKPESYPVFMITRSIKASNETKKQALNDINRIMNRLNQGEDFEKLAKAESDCPSSIKGGDLGFFGRGVMVKAFEDAAFALNPGEMSRVIETRFGYHIIKMEEKKDDEIRVRHILKMIKPSTEDINKEKTLMDSLLTALRNGADPKAIGSKYSEDEGAKENGGILGVFTVDEYPEMFKGTIDSLSANTYTNVIQQEDMLYIIGKLNVVPAHPYEYNDIKDRLKEMYIQEKQFDLYKKWIANIKKEYYVQINLKEEK